MIPVSEPLFAGRELEYLTECIRSGWVSSTGPFVRDFESRWAGYCGRKHGVAVSSGTMALFAAASALDLQPGDEVIMPTFTIIACASAVVFAGGTPVLVDSDPGTWTIDASGIERKITPRTRAIMPVHIYGHPTDMEPVLALARSHQLAVIEDAAEAHGAEYLSGRQSAAPSWRPCGSFGDMSCFSFFGNKNVTTGEGGMVVTDNDDLAEKCRAFRDLHFQRERRFRHDALGMSARMSSLQAAVGLGQIERIDEILARKRWMGQAYSERLADVPGLSLQEQQPWARSAYWMFGVVLKEKTGLDAATAIKRLADRGVETRPFFLGMHEQPVFQQRGWYFGEDYPIAHRLARQGFYLPSGVALTEAQLEEVCRSVREVVS